MVVDEVVIEAELVGTIRDAVDGVRYLTHVELDNEMGIIDMTGFFFSDIVEGLQRIRERYD